MKQAVSKTRFLPSCTLRQQGCDHTGQQLAGELPSALSFTPASLPPQPSSLLPPPSLRAAFPHPSRRRGRADLGERQAGTGGKTYGLFLSINLMSLLPCWDGGACPGGQRCCRARGSAAGAGTGGGQAEYSLRAAQYHHCPPSIPQRLGKEGGEVGRRRREGWTSVYLGRGKSEGGGGEARFEAAEAAAKNAPL